MCRKDDNFGFAMGILGGVVAGVIAGVLFAPKPGKESREELKEAIDNLRKSILPKL